MLDKGSRRGTKWNKWDLHVHTPASIEQQYGSDKKNEVWEEYISDLENLPPEIKAIGINDYFTLDGYKRVQKAQKDGRLQNLKVILPVVELRLKMLAGNKKMQRINYHIIFSDELTMDEIEAHFLNKLSISYKLEDGKQHTIVGCDRKSLANLGQAIISSTPTDKRSNDPALKVGFANAVFSEEEIHKLRKQTIFDKKIITALGITEWDDMRFDGGGTGIKRDLINSTDLVFVASPDASSYRNRHNQLVKAEVNSRLLDCSDAHHLSSSDESMRLGNTFSWINADLTFEGLQRAVRCFDERVNVIDAGKKPTKLSILQTKRGKFIERIEIRKKDNSSLTEKWFDCEIPLNAGLIAIIGNQGSGKSALTDIIALCGNTKTPHFSFLSPDKFRDRENKAAEFTATLYWEDGVQTQRCLSDDVDRTEVEYVRYVPQHFFDAITNETAVHQQSQFYAEIKKVIFSHIDQSDRLGRASLDELVDWRTKEIKQTVNSLREELSNLNQEIIQSEEQLTPSALKRLDKIISQKQQEIAAHQLTKPVEIPRPADSTDINSEIEALRKEEAKLHTELDSLQKSLTTEKTRQEVVRQKRQSAENEQDRIRNLIKEWQQEFERHGINLKANEIISIKIDWSHFDNELTRLSHEITQKESLTNNEAQDSPAQKLAKVVENREELQSSLAENHGAYQQYLSAEQEWLNQQKMLIGDLNTPDSLEWLKHKKSEVTSELPKQLDVLYANRNELVTKIHEQLWSLAAIYEELAKDVRDYISADELTRERYHLQFDIHLAEQGFIERFFQMTKHRGSFAGVEEGPAIVSELLKKRDFNVSKDVAEFTEDILSRLKSDHRQATLVADDIEKMIRKNQDIRELYDYIFGLTYLQPHYTISLNDKPLKMLSPGERGVLLLVFYLIIDQDDKPLIIDQPEGNLNNQAIVRDLVPVFKEAKKRRQIIMVTHNPNLAVVSDAEQIIHAHIDFEDDNKVYFESGAMENPKFNDLMVDVLEGTRPAFTTRRDTYYALA